MSEPRFLFDLGFPFAYLAAERLRQVIPQPVRWQPVLLGGLFKLHGRSSWARSPRRDLGMAEVEARARHYGLPPMTWPDGWPGDYLCAMRAAVVADEHGLVREFALAALRDQFAGGRHLAELDAVLDVAAGVGLDRDAVARRIEDADVKQRLMALTQDAAARGVRGVPTLLAGDTVHWGDDQLEVAAMSLAAPQGA